MHYSYRKKLIKVANDYRDPNALVSTYPYRENTWTCAGKFLWRTVNICAHSHTEQQMETPKHVRARLVASKNEIERFIRNLAIRHWGAKSQSCCGVQGIARIQDTIIKTLLRVFRVRARRFSFFLSFVFQRKSTIVDILRPRISQSICSHRPHLFWRGVAEGGGRIESIVPLMAPKCGRETCCALGFWKIQSLRFRENTACFKRKKRMKSTGDSPSPFY